MCMHQHGKKILSYAVLFLDDCFVQIYLNLSYLEFMGCIGEGAQKPKGFESWIG